MATRRSPLRTAAFKELPKRVEKIRTRAEELIRRTWREALAMLPPRPRKAVKDAVARVEKAAAELDRRRERALKAVDRQRKDLVARVEDRAVGAVKPLVHRLEVASRHDVEMLSRRVARLEHRFERQAKRERVAAA